MMVLATRCCQLYTIPDSLVDYRVVWLHQIHKTDPNDGSGYKMLSVVYYSRWPGRLELSGCTKLTQMMVLATRCCQLYTIPDGLVDYRVVWLHQIHKTDPNDGSGYKMLSVVYYSRWPGRL